MRATRLPLVLLGLAACGNSTTPSSPRDPGTEQPPTAAAAPAEKPITEADGLVVLSRGAEPRRALRMTGKTGDASDVETVVTGQIEAFHPGGAVTSHLPAAYGFQHRSIVGVDHGRFHVHLEPRAIKVPDRPAREAQIKLEPIDVDVDEHAAVLPSPGVDQLSQQLQQATGGMPIQLDTLEHFRLPETPVGVGAHWRVQFQPSVAGTPIDTQVDLRLTKLDGSSMTLEVVGKAKKPVVIQLPGGVSVHMDAIEHHGTLRRSLALFASTEMSIEGDSRYTVVFEYDGERLSETHYRATWNFGASSPPADRPGQLKPTASSGARARRCAARVAALRARMNGWSQQLPEAVDFLDSPVPFGFDAPAGLDPMVRFAPGSLGIQLEPSNGVTLRQERSLAWKRASIDAAFVGRLLKEIDDTRRRLHAAPMVAVIAAPGTNVSAIEKLRGKLPPLSAYGFVSVPANVRFTGTADELVARLRAR